jgi:hypothetical protein
MGHLRGIRCYLNPIDQFIRLSFRDHSRKHISTYNKKIGRERVSLSETPLREKRFGRAPIYENGKGDSSDTFHYSVNEFRGEVHRS